MNNPLNKQLLYTVIGIVVVKFLEDYFHRDLVYPFASGLIINYLTKASASLKKHNHSFWAYIHLGFLVIFLFLAVYYLVSSSTEFSLKAFLFIFGYFVGVRSKAFEPKNTDDNAILKGGATTDVSYNPFDKGLDKGEEGVRKTFANKRKKSEETKKDE
jgi:hypothetical protein